MSPLEAAQRALTAALRNPQAPAPDGVPDATLALYRQLLRGNIDRALTRAFPVLRAVSDDAAWAARVDAFVAEHGIDEPQLRKLAEVFIAWLDGRSDEARQQDPPWLAELCHYEWVERALGDDTTPLPKAAAFAMNRPPLVSPLAWPLSYRYAVHQIGPDAIPGEAPAQPTYLIAYRDRSDAVRFMEINALTLLLLRAIDSQPDVAAADLLATLADELGHADAGAVVEAGTQLLRQLLERGVLLGSRPG